LSKQRKNEKQRALAAQITEMHKKGQRGPKQTTPKHEKNPSKRIYTKTKRGLKDTTK
jgi:hypothetical protein